MSGRPERLFALFGSLESLSGIGAKTARHFAQMGITRPRDLLMTLPAGGIDRRVVPGIAGLPSDTVATVTITVLRHLPGRNAAAPYRIEVEDGQTAFQLVYFHARRDWLERHLPEGARRVISGRIEHFDGRVQMVHPDHVLPVDAADQIPVFEAVYPLTAGVTQRLITKAARAAVAMAPDLGEWIDPALRMREGWPDWHTALAQAHAPNAARDLSPDAPARRRLAYDELFAHQCTLALARAVERARAGRVTSGNGSLRARLFAALPFRPTGAQLRAMDEIAADMAAPRRMNRLLQGDVGSGKTLVAFAALLTAVEAGGQGVLMAPTEILARQHHAGLLPLAEAAGVVIALLTGRDKGAERESKLAALADGRIQILIGTHAVFQKTVEFQGLRLAVIDEQHRFGVAQRMALGRKGQAVDTLVMTATPIPRSLSLAAYGFMDVSVLDEKPPGRTPVKTAMVSDTRLPEVVAHLAEALGQGRQAYWVCPLVEESETLDLMAAEARFAQLRAELGADRVGLVHGQMPAADKDAVMARFANAELGLLVATTVIEVGVDVPNASIMVIERAESFGLAQLHQLRGRVGRGAAASTCLLFYRAPLSPGGQRRLELMRETDDGFRIAEEDLAMRGAGDVIGTAQSGLPRFRIADLERQADLMAIAQSDARAFLAQDPALESPRGQAVRHLLWLMEQDRGIQLLDVG